MRRATHRRVEHSVGPLVSGAYHAGVLFYLIACVTFPTRPSPPPVVEVEIAECEPFELDTVPLSDDLNNTPDEPRIDPAIEGMPPPLEDLPLFENETPPEASPVPLYAAQRFRLPTVYAQRATPALRKWCLRRHLGPGEADAVEWAVLRGLRWLKANQRSDGAWGEKAEHRVGLSGLALLAFLGHGETPASREFGATVEGGLQFLTERQSANGGFEVLDKPGTYGHAIATLALAEAYSLTHAPGLAEAVERAVRVILAGQQDSGGWDYRYSKWRRRDTSVTGWHVQALHAARVAGLGGRDVDLSLARAGEDLTGASEPRRGTFRYDLADAPTSWGITATGVLGLQLIGRADATPLEAGLDSLRTMPCTWRQGNWILCGIYYATQAKFNAAHRHTARQGEWTRWNALFPGVLAGAQERDGHWTPPANETPYGAVYGTAMAVLTLEVYYRLLPGARPPEPRIAARTEPGLLPDDVPIRFD
ncbi:MAG: terpene cyclase/mutase family protein [Kiritimatiellae bacterium]|nr:terpene cyclase/mutase family protein [Kiritimatiellia bacterium]